MRDNRSITIVGLDIEGYSNRSLEEQYSAQSQLENWVIEACKSANITSALKKVIWVDTGDGGFLITYPSYSQALIFLEAFYSLLHDHNVRVKKEAEIYVRAAVHASDVIHWKGKLGQKYAGNALNVCARLLNGMNRKYRNQVVCSGEYLQKLRPLGQLVTPRRLPDHVDKHGVVHEIWNLQKNPGLGIEPESDDLHEHPMRWYPD